MNSDNKSQASDSKQLQPRPAKKKYRYPARVRRRIFYTIVAALLIIILAVCIGSCNSHRSKQEMLSSDPFRLASNGEYNTLIKAYNLEDITPERKALIERALIDAVDNEIKNALSGDQKNFNKLISKIDKVQPLYDKYYYLADNKSKVKRYVSYYNSGREAFKAGNYGEGLKHFYMIPDDFLAGISAGNLSYLDLKNDAYNECMTQARNLYNSGQYEKCNDAAKSILSVYPDDKNAKNLVFSTTNLVEYTGNVEHIFFHPLIAYPNRAFQSADADVRLGQDNHMVTVTEFKNILNQLYENNYVIIDIHALCDITRSGTNVTVKQRTLMLPEGKKPIIISVDDLNYYSYMQRDGQVAKLILNENGDVVTYSVNDAGEEVISADNEIIPILNAFVEEHPDFVINGARGTIALTGYLGILGYRTDEPTWGGYEQELAGATEVVERLKETGWTFASHSQGHRHSNAISYDLFVNDTDRWEREVGSIVGDVDVYVYPFGEDVPVYDDKFAYLKKNGFVIFCSDAKVSVTDYGDTYMNQSRRAVDGVSFKDSRLYDIFNVPAIVDPVRPWYNDWSTTYWQTGEIPPASKYEIGEIY